MLKKAGLLTVGVGVTLMAAAPFASAGEYCPPDNGGHNKDHHGDHHKSWNQHGVGNIKCSASSGDVKDNHSKGILALGPILDGNAGQLASCNSFLNDNLSGNHVNIASIPLT